MILINDLMEYEITKSRFEDLVVWKKARDIRICISNLTKRFPFEENINM